MGQLPHVPEPTSAYRRHELERGDLEGIMGLGGRIFASTYDFQMRRAEKAGLRERRKSLLAGAYGDVLEIGGGTGANLVHYPPAVRTLTVTEPERAMVRRLERAARAQSRPVTVLCAPAEELPFNDAVFDVVVSTLVLCTVHDQSQALREVRRVLRPGGLLLFFEHIRSGDPRIARKQDRMNRINRVVMHGCNCNRPTLETIEAEGFTVTNVEHGVIPKVPHFVEPLVTGSATAPIAVHQ
jgi:SAM-dependent methyltransferase